MVPKHFVERTFGGRRRRRDVDRRPGLEVIWRMLVVSSDLRALVVFFVHVFGVQLVVWTNIRLVRSHSWRAASRSRGPGSPPSPGRHPHQEQEGDFVTLDQAPCLLHGFRRIEGVVVIDEIDIAAGDAALVVDHPEIGIRAFRDHAQGRDRAAQRGGAADFDP